MCEDRDWIKDAETHEGFVIIKFVDDPRWFCRILSGNKMSYGLGDTMFDAYTDACKHLAEFVIDIANANLLRKP